MTTTNDVREALAQNLNDYDAQTTHSPDGLRVSVSDDEIGLFEKTLRTEGLSDAVAFKKRRGDWLVAEFDVERSGGLRDLFR